MSATAQSRILMVGLPQSGKTTFLAALWHIVNETGVTRCLSFRRLHADREYLNRIRASWLACRPLERTPLHDDQTATLCLSSSDGAVLEVAIPDLSGEAFEIQLRQRRLPRSYDALVQEIDGVLLFVHPESMGPDHRLDTAGRMRGEVTADTPTAISAPGGIPEASGIPWSPELAPPQVKLVELVQFLLARRGGALLQVAVIISAWDLLAADGLSPQDTLRRRLSLLWQFLSANPDRVRYIVVGVSAQGGDLQGDRQELLQHRRQSARVRVEGMQCDPHDLTAPLWWLLEDESAH